MLLLGRKLLSFTLLSFFLMTSTLCFSKTTWKGKAVYQLVTDRFAMHDSPSTRCQSNSPCGGTWSGITENLDYIQDMGFDAVGISPITKDAKMKWDGYWTQSFNDLDSKFGSSDDLLELVRTIQSKKMLALVDIMLNHVGNEKYKKVKPFNNKSYYHDKCLITDQDDMQQLVSCRIDKGQPDLNQTEVFVRDNLLDATTSVLSTYSFDGARVPYAINVDRSFLTYLQENINVFFVGQVSHTSTDVNWFAGYSYLFPSMMNYPLHNAIIDAFTGSNQGLKDVASVLNQGFVKYQDPDLIGNFIDTDDTPRFLLRLDYDEVSFFNALALVLTSKGMPIIYYGTEQAIAGEGIVSLGQNRPSLWPEYETNKEEYNFIKRVLHQRKEDNYALEDHTDLYVDADTYAYSRGPFFIAAITRLSTATINIPAPASISDNTRYCSVLGDGFCVTVISGHLMLQFKERPLLLQFNGTATPTTSSTSSTSSSSTSSSSTSSSSTSTSSGSTLRPTPRDTLTPAPSDSDSGDRHSGLAVGLTIGLALPIALFAFALLGYFYIKRKRYADIDSASSVVNNSQASGYSL